MRELTDRLGRHVSCAHLSTVAACNFRCGDRPAVGDPPHADLRAPLRRDDIVRRVAATTTVGGAA
jgi:molybdenum cofactor biosynthesis enzyme MoaA